MHRRRFLSLATGLVALGAACQPKPSEPTNQSPSPNSPQAPPADNRAVPAPAAIPAKGDPPMTNSPSKPDSAAPSRMPTLFVGHGNPMHALGNNRFAEAWRKLGESLPRPAAILAVSAHWYQPLLATTGETTPKTIHDFYGFPPELYQLSYPAPGSPELAADVVSLLKDQGASLSTAWGLDHGTWSVLLHLFPQADIPVVQLSIHSDLSPATHIQLASKLAPLRDQGVLILGSGNITHNLRFAMEAMRRNDLSSADWADRFDLAVAAALSKHDREFLTSALQTPDGRRSHPTPDHYLPLLYPAGAADTLDAVTFPLEGMDMGTLSMRCVRFG